MAKKRPVQAAAKPTTETSAAESATESAARTPAQSATERPIQKRSNLQLIIGVTLGTVFGAVGLKTLLSPSPEAAEHRVLLIGHVTVSAIFVLVNVLVLINRYKEKKGLAAKETK